MGAVPTTAYLPGVAAKALPIRDPRCESWTVLEDKRAADTDLTHDLVVRETGIAARYVRLTVTETAYGAPACISGLRVFGRGQGKLPAQASQVTVRRTDGMTMEVSWQGDGVGYEVLWGHAPDKLYHSFRVFGKTQVEIRALSASTEHYYVRVDAFNENGITEGKVTLLSNPDILKRQ